MGVWLRYSLFVTIVVASTCLSCIMAMRQYDMDSGNIFRLEGEYSFAFWWGKYDYDNREFVGHTNWLKRNDTNDSTLLFDVYHYPSEPLSRSPMRFRVESLLVYIGDALEPARPKCILDTVYTSPDNWYYKGPRRHLSYGPIRIGKPEPKVIVATFDLVILDSEMGREIDRERIAVKASRKTKSILMDFLDGQ